MKTIFCHTCSLVSVLPLVAERIAIVGEWTHSVVLVVSVVLTIAELIAVIRNRQKLHMDRIPTYLMIAAIGASIWMIGLVISWAWLNHLGYMLYAGGHITKSLKDFLGHIA